MRKTILLKAIALLLIISSCSDDEGQDLIDFTVNFTSETVSTNEEDTSVDVQLNFSRPASEAGTINIAYTGTNAEYGTDFTTTPDGGSGTIAINVAEGDQNASFTFNKLTNAIEGSTKSVSFSIDGFDNIDWSQGAAASTLVSFTPIASTSGVIDSENGGATIPNQVYFDFSSATQTVVKRDTWEIALYNGTENRVFLNSALAVSAVELTGVTDLLTITEASNLSEPMELIGLNAMFQPEPVTVNTVSELLEGLPVGYYQYGNLDEGISFTDNPEGTLEDTAFSEVSTTAEENHVYIVSMGNEIPIEGELEEPIDPGSINTTGDHRGFLKVRILSDGNNYTIQYADLAETDSYSEVTVAKDAAYNLTAFSLTNGETVSVEPTKEQWDINLSGVFAYYGDSGGLVAGLTYSDYVVHNNLGGAGVYQVIVEDDAPTYTDFSMGNVDEASFVFNNRSQIGTGWRQPYGGPVYEDRYYVLKDIDGNYYKFMFTAYTSTEGERGNYQFTYERL
ncbi:HmuY family protein [Muricauda sp. 334s03]|uniref:HmuY family protein n=1 Tax=Flagellimonas yonaguniensis TaxID=3031325 RepID=A0ABT5Y3H6_9FLAO|nr:HmuY family protein [[Muricauda] yonaguniensis]MDF0717991.1 HmuY family protein [[Muricauda] yonaguniensis]